KEGARSVLASKPFSRQANRPILPPRGGPFAVYHQRLVPITFLHQPSLSSPIQPRSAPGLRARNHNAAEESLATSGSRSARDDHCQPPAWPCREPSTIRSPCSSTQ
ncbi:hypothetical protein Dimus_026489, partial [Dionaea muscipula]